MTTDEIILLVIVVCIGIPSARFNLTSVGLVISYGVSQLVWKVTGEAISVPSMLLCDYLVMVLIWAKPDVYECPYTGLAAQFCALWFERSYADRIVLSFFSLAWFCYAINFDAFYRWWALWWIALVQLIVAGWEGYSVWQQRRSAKDHTSPNVTLRLAWSEHA